MICNTIQLEEEWEKAFVQKEKSKLDPVLWKILIYRVNIWVEEYIS